MALRLRKVVAAFKFSQQKTVRYSFDFASHMIPHPAKAYKGGQDAIYTSKNLLVVADGVGGWADSGIDPGLYSKKLCSLIGQKIESNFDKYIDNPQQLLIDSVKENKQQGSTTVCMLSLNPTTGKMINYYLGDSLMGIFYPEKYFLAPEQQKSFNFPFQVGSVGDNPNEGLTLELTADQYQDGTIILASDGVWDNIDGSQVADGIYKDSGKKQLKQIAQEVCKKTYKYSLSDEYESPFYKKALESGFRYYKSGKSDDISLIIGRIIRQQI